MPSFLRALATLVIAAPSLAPAQEQQPQDQPVTRPAAAERIVRTFDFERSPREIFAIPRYWDLAQDGSPSTGPRPTYPRFNTAEFDFTTASRGEGSVRLYAEVGSVCLRLDPGVIPVFPSTEYLVSARVRTTPLRHARAAVTARFLDQASNPIPGTERRSTLAAGESWTLVTANLPGETANAAFLQIDLELLQPREFQNATLGPHHVWPQDFPASAWFDDVSVVQLPRVRLETNSPVGVITAPQSPILTATVRDLTGEAMHMNVIVQDAAGRTIDSRNTRLEPGSDVWKWTPRLPGFGWFRATLELTNNAARVGSTCTDFVWLPPAARSSESDPHAFTILLRDLPQDCGAPLDALLRALGAGQVSLPVWNADLTPASMAQNVDHISAVIHALGPNTDITFTLPTLPAELADTARVERERVPAAFQAPDHLWSPYLLPLLDKFGQRVQQWQVGTVHAARPARDAPGVERLRTFLSRLVPGPTLLSPSPAEIPAFASPREQLLHIAPAIPPAAVGELARQRSPDPFARPTFALETLPHQYARDQAALDLARRAVEIWAATRAAPDALAPRIALHQPWSWATSARPIMPSPEFAALRTTIEQLSGRHLATTFPVDPAITAYLFVSPDQRSGTLIAWRSGPADPVILRAFLGAGRVTACDIFGNRTPIPLTSDGPGPMVHRIPLGDSPTFIENVDPQLCQFIAAFAIDPPVIPIAVGEHQIELHLNNPWSSRVDGRITILEPGGLSSGEPETRDRSWRIQPRAMPFSVGPGQTTALPVSIMFSGVEDAGMKQFVVELELNAERSYPPVRIAHTIELAADRVQLDLSYRHVKETNDLIVEAQVTNKFTAPMTLELSAIAPGVPRSKASISDLEPGATATRRFVLANAARQLRGQTVTVTAQEFQTRARITRSIRPD